MSKYIYTSIHVRETLLLVTMQLSKVNSLRVYIEEVTAPHTQCFLCNILYVHVCHIRWFYLDSFPGNLSLILFFIYNLAFVLIN